MENVKQEENKEKEQEKEDVERITLAALSEYERQMLHRTNIIIELLEQATKNKKNTNEIDLS